MARPTKQGLDYFPHDTDARGDIKIKALMAIHGAKGYCFYFSMLEEVFRQENGRITAGSMAIKAGLAKDMCISVKEFDEILMTALEVGCFDKAIFEAEQVITSPGIQKRLDRVNHDREQERIRKENYLLKKKKKYKEKGKTGRGKPAENSPPSQDVEIKEKYLRYVYLKKSEYEKLVGKLNGKTEDFIERLDTYIGQIGERKAAAKYKSHYDTILNFYRRDQAEDKRKDQYI